MKTSLFAATLIIFTGASNSFAALQCSDQYNDIQRILHNGIDPVARDNVQRTQALFQNASNLERAVMTPGQTPQFEQSINSGLEQAANQNLHTRQALFNVRSLLTTDFEAAYKRALQTICNGQCQPGTSDARHMEAVNELRAIVNNAMENNVVSANSEAEASNASIQNAKAAVTRAQQAVNQGGPQAGTVRLAQTVRQLANDTLRASTAIVGDVFGGSAPSLNNLGSQLDDFASRGCVNNTR